MRQQAAHGFAVCAAVSSKLDHLGLYWLCAHGRKVPAGQLQELHRLTGFEAASASTTLAAAAAQKQGIL